MEQFAYLHTYVPVGKTSECRVFHALVIREENGMKCSESESATVIFYTSMIPKPPHCWGSTSRQSLQRALLGICDGISGLVRPHFSRHQELRRPLFL